ncbi:MAG: ATP-binding protein [Peptostreptococcaceae bacterium]|nr:ATP-binding protein [Peptostreptococcaceae bacterium]
MIFYERNGYEVAEICSCRQVEMAKTRIERSGISEEFRKKTFGNFEESPATAEAKRICMAYVSDYEKNSLMLSGQVGSGKTHLAIAILNNLLKRGVPVIYLEYRSFMTRMKQSIMDRDYYARELERYQKIPVLLIDDLFKGKITESDVQILYELINFRYFNKRSTIFTSEKDVNHLLDIDEAVGSRIYEMCRKYRIRMSGDNYRLR